jgi:hypothetical protein
LLLAIWCIFDLPCRKRDELYWYPKNRVAQSDS